MRKAFKSVKDRSTLFPWILLFVTLILHSAIIINVSESSGEPFQKYLNGADRFISGDIDPERASDFSPFYLQIHIVVKKIFKDPITVIIAMNILLISVSSVLLFLILRFFFPVIISVGGYLFFILSPGILVYAKVMEPEPLQIFFITAMLWFLLRFSLGEKKYRVIDIFLSGVFLAFTIVTRSNLFLLLIFIPVYIYFYLYKNIGSGVNWKRLILTFSIAPVVAILVIIIINYANTGYFSYYYQNPGYILFEGNNPNSRGQSAIYPPIVDDMVYEYKGEPDVHHKIYRIFARRINKRDMTVPEVNDFWSGKAFNFILDHPVYFLKKGVIKLHYFFHNYRRHDVKEAYDHDRAISESHVPVLPFWIVSSLAFTGLLLGLKNIWKLFPLYAVFGVQAAVLLAGYVSSRQRISIMVVFIFFACLSVDRLTEKKHLLPALILIPALCIPLFLVKNDFIKEEEFLWNAYSRSYADWTKAKQERDEMNFNRAGEYAARSLIHTPWLNEERRPAEIGFGRNGIAGDALKYLKLNVSDSHSERFNKAILLYKGGDLGGSEKIFEDLIKKGRGFKRDFDHSSQPEYWLGMINLKRGAADKAADLFRKALKGSPGSPFALSYLYALTGEEIYEKKICKYFDKIDAYYFIGRSFLKIRMFHSAVKYLSYVHETVPEFRKGNICYAVALAGSGDKVSAYTILVEAMKKRREPLMFEKEVKDVFRERIKIQPDNGAAHFYLGLVYEQYGNFSDGLEHYLKSQKLMGEREIISSKITRIKEKILKKKGQRSGN